MPKQARARRTYELALDAAAAEFARHGFGNTNLQVVAARLGLTKGALYGHFSSKEEIAARLVAELDEVLRPPPDAESQPAHRRLRELVLTLAERIEHDVRVGAAVRLVWEEARASGEQPAFWRRLREMVSGLVRQAQREGGIDAAGPPEALADLLVAVPFGVHYVAGATGHGDLPGRVRAIWRLLVPVLGGPGPDGP
jgi:AcrR family transcriptional regulator